MSRDKELKHALLRKVFQVITALSVCAFVQPSAAGDGLKLGVPHISIFPPVELYNAENKRVLLLDANVIMGKCGGFVGVEAAGLINKCGSAIGIQAAPINFTGTAPFLIQAGVDNSVPGDFCGIQVGVWNANNEEYSAMVGRSATGDHDVVGTLGEQHSEGTTKGISVGLVNGSQNFFGINFGYFVSRTRNLLGIQAAGFFALATRWGNDASNASTGNAVGIQVAGATWAYNVLGIQAGILNLITTGGENSNGAPSNYTGDLFGIQIGGVNYAHEVHGIQAGFFNIAGTLHGIQIGLFNFAGHAMMPFMVGLNVGF